MEQLAERHSNIHEERYGSPEDTLEKLKRHVDVLSDLLEAARAEIGLLTEQNETNPDSRAAAMSRTHEAVKRSKQNEVSRRRESGVLIPTKELARLRGVSRSAITEAYNANRVFRFQEGRNFLYPAFFGDSTLDQGKVERVVRALGRIPEFNKLHFFESRFEDLEGATPIEAIRNGFDFSIVLQAAQRLGCTSDE